QVVAILVRLLARQRQYDEAYRQMQAIPLTQRAALLSTTEAEILRNVGDAEGAYKSAEKLVESAPEDANVQLWFADMASNANNLDAAIEAANRSVELQPGSLRAWNALVTIYLQRKEPDEVERTLRRAQLALDANFIPNLTAQYYLRVGKWTRAENIKLADWESGPQDSRAAREMANFYLIWDVNKPGSPEIIEKAKPFINHIINEAYDGKIAFDSDDAQWALRKAATMMARTGDYRDSVKAEKLLTTAYEAAQEKEQMANLLADILAVRRDPNSWLRAVDIFQDLKKRVGLQKASDVRLARLLFQVGEWEACKEHTEELLTRYSDDVKIRVMYLAMLIEKGEFKEADRYLTGIQELDPKGKLTGELRIQLAAARGDTKQTRRLLEALTPSARKLTNETLPRLLTVAKIATGAKDYEYAEQLMETFLKYQKNNAEIRLQLAKLRAMHLDAEQGLQDMRPFFNDNMTSILQASVAALRARRPEYGDKLDDVVNQRVQRALRDDPEAASRLLAEAETFEIQEQFDKAIAAYEKMLERDDLPMTIRASATNNLAYLYALSGQQVDRALELV
ncbi:MAG: tetratricopeptide repeat protein, partial [Lacipirellulaceae bacterium]